MNTTENKNQDRTASQLMRLLGTKPTLHLTLKKRPFEVMVTGEKKIEMRKPTDWIKSRLEGKEYDYVKFTNGYGSDRPFFISEYLGFERFQMIGEMKYSNGLEVPFMFGDYAIYLGDVLHTENLEVLA